MNPEEIKALEKICNVSTKKDKSNVKQEASTGILREVTSKKVMIKVIYKSIMVHLRSI